MIEVSLEERLRIAAEKIEKICRDYDVDLSPKYDDGVAVIIHGTEPLKDGKGERYLEEEITT